MRAIRFVALAALAACAVQAGEEAASKPCDQMHFHEFDFWVGEWEVRDETGQLAGHNTITSEQAGCVIVERWRSVAGNDGMSMNYYEPRSGRWKQNWISPDLILEMSGGRQGNDLVLEGPLQYLGKNRTTVLRGIWTPLPDGRVRQHFIESQDGGKTWQEWFDGYYSRVVASR